MACSFRYFLLKRCQGLTGLNTTSTKKFFAAAEDAHPEAFAPLLLLAICDGREEYLLRRAEGTKAAEMFDEFVEHWHASGRPLEVYLGMLPDGDPFKTILVEWRTEMCIRDRLMVALVGGRIARGLGKAHLLQLAQGRKINLLTEQARQHAVGSGAGVHQFDEMCIRDRL